MAKRTSGKTSRQVHKPLQKSSRKQFICFSKTAKAVMTVGIIIAAIAVLGSVMLSGYFTPEKLANDALMEIVDDYYENYYYGKFIKSLPKEKSFEDAMKEAEKDGFPKIYLRHLLLFDNGKYKNKEKLFDSNRYKCDENSVSVKIYPVEPFGPKDYKTIYDTSSCKSK